MSNKIFIDGLGEFEILPVTPKYALKFIGITLDRKDNTFQYYKLFEGENIEFTGEFFAKFVIFEGKKMPLHKIDELFTGNVSDLFILLSHFLTSMTDKKKVLDSNQKENLQEKS